MAGSRRVELSLGVVGFSMIEHIFRSCLPLVFECFEWKENEKIDHEACDVGRSLLSIEVRYLVSAWFLVIITKRVYPYLPMHVDTSMPS